MIRDVDLISYLPPFMQTYKEPVAALEAENPEFYIIWSAADKVLRNRFISTADEYGLSRFEKLLGIYPSEEDTVESRRSRVQARWFNSIPYTLKALIAKLVTLCGNSDFTIVKGYQNYRIEILTNLELFGQVEELERMIDSMLPCNMVVISENEIQCGVDGFALVGGGVCSVEHFFITNDSKETAVVSGSVLYGGGVINSATVVITNDFNEQFSIGGEHLAGSGVVATELIEIKQ